jgi:hypothetical protein
MIWFWLLLLIIVFLFGLTAFFGAPYVPSQKKHIRQALHELYIIGKKDTLVDIGSGDGVVLREASKTGAHAIGFEINPILVLISRFLSRNDKQVSIRLHDIWLSHLPDETTVIYVFSVKRDIKRTKKWLQSEINRIDHPVSLISYGFKFTDIKPIKKLGPYYLYIFRPLHQVKPQV